VIFDSHAHVWERWPYRPEVPDPDSRGRAESLLWEMDLNGVDRAVVIVASIAGNPENNAYAFGHAATKTGRLVPFADADSRWWPYHHTPGAAGRLEQLVARFRPRGITHYMVEDADPSWLLADEGIAFARTAERHGLILSLACGPFQVPTVAALAERVPRLPILLHHLARVRADVGREESGLRHVLDAARRPNLFVKASGFGYGLARDPWDFPLAPMLDIFRAIYDVYGPQRMMWASDYPVVNRFMTYRQSLEIVRSKCRFLSEADLTHMLGGTIWRIIGPV
jgi:predicted TIM-barrel fold metal-dependent hydrolase